MNWVKPPFYSDKIFKNFVWNIPNNNNKVYLTFDDGPTEGITEKVLSILDKYNIKATFFCLGRNIDRYKTLFENIIKKGHSVGNHTYSHLNGWKTENKEYFNDIEYASTIIKNKIFRPPYGKIKPSQYKKLKHNYKLIMWDVLTGDYNHKLTGETCYLNIVKNVKSGSVIVFHDSDKAHKNLFYSLPKAIEYLQKQGYKFGVISDSELTNT